MKNRMQDNKVRAGPCLIEIPFKRMSVFHCMALYSSAGYNFEVVKKENIFFGFILEYYNLYESNS